MNSREKIKAEYVESLRDYSFAYSLASHAPGLRKDSAAYLRKESARLAREADIWAREAVLREEADA